MSGNTRISETNSNHMHWISHSNIFCWEKFWPGDFVYRYINLKHQHPPIPGVVLAPSPPPGVGQPLWGWGKTLHSHAKHSSVIFPFFHLYIAHRSGEFDCPCDITCEAFEQVEGPRGSRGIWRLINTFIKPDGTICRLQVAGCRLQVKFAGWICRSRIEV